MENNTENIAALQTHFNFATKDDLKLSVGRLEALYADLLDNLLYYSLVSETDKAACMTL